VSIPARITLVRELAHGLPTLIGDATLINQVVMNLVTNAADAMAGHDGTLTLRTHQVTLDEAAAQRDFHGQDVAPGRYLALEVEDTGSGMTPELISRIFDPFFSTKQAGRGLGLSSVLGTMKGHRGGIHIHSRPGLGTLFHLVFPLEPPAAQPAAPPVPSAPPAGTPAAASHQGAVLLVDDEANARGSSRALLKYLGFSVVEAEDGEAAVAAFKALRAGIAWVLMDLTMPRMDGHAAFRAMRLLDPSVKVVLCSGWAEDDLSRRFRDDPPTAFLAKPFTLEDVEALVQREGLAPHGKSG
jgi:CheY-like chemotaxis protein